jgi:hypothetical protein
MHPAPSPIVSQLIPAFGKTGMFLNGSDVRIARGARAWRWSAERASPPATIVFSSEAQAGSRGEDASEQQSKPGSDSIRPIRLWVN